MAGHKHRNAIHRIPLYPILEKFSVKQNDEIRQVSTLQTLNRHGTLAE
jgi:hypothetical protein